MPPLKKNADPLHSAPAALVGGEGPEAPVEEGTLRKVFIAPIKSAAKTVHTQDDPSKLVADFDEVFSLGYIPLDSFSKKIKLALKKAADKKVEIKTIDFARDGYITDVLIKTLFEVLPKSTVEKISRVSLEGCSMITDLGLHWLVQGLSVVQHSVQININGCTKVTDAGLALLANASYIGYVDAMATNVVHLKKAGNTKGCPLLIDPTHIEFTVQKTSYLLIVPIKTKTSLSAFLSTKSKQERQSVQHLKETKISDWKVNITELQQNHVLFDHALPRDPVHVIMTFDANSDISDVKDQIVGTIAHILSKETLNPPHVIKHKKKTFHTKGFLESSTCSQLELTLDGILRNTSDNQEVIGTFVSKQPFSRTNCYYEIQCLSAPQDTGILLGALNDAVVCERNPVNSEESNGGAYEGFELEDDTIYGLGIKGTWESEFVPSDDAIFYVTKNGQQVKTLSDKPDSGAYPFLSVFGKNLASVKLLNMACPSPALVEQWEQKKQFWSPGFTHNVLCDDQGILSCEESYTTEGERGIFICQESITKEHNTFSVKVVDLKTDGIITVGFGPENYSTNRHPGWDSGSVALHGDDGRVYIQSGSGSMPSTNELYIWKNGDVITAVVSGMGNSDTIQTKEEIEVDFYVNKKLIANVKTKLKNVNKGIRFVFMLGMRNVGTKAQIMNYRPVYIPPPARMDMLTMGRSYYINAYDDGCLKYRPFGSRDSFGLFLSKTPFNYQLTYFECVVKSVGSKRHIGIGFAGRNYPINTMLGWRLSSVGYHADNGLLYHNSSSGHITIETESLQFNTGDVIGCGLDVATTKFRPDGSLENQQIIKFYFTKNGKRVHEVDFHYQSDGIYPGVNLHYNSDEVLLKNFYPGVEHGISELESVVEVDQEEQSFIEGCRFTVVGMQENGVKLKGKIQILQQAFEDLSFSTIPVIEQHLQFLSSNIKMLDMQGQQLFGQLTWQKECLERFLHNKSRLKFLTVDVLSAEGHDELIKHIVKVCEEDLAYHSKLYEVQASVSKGLKKIVDKLSEEKLIDTETMRDLVGEELGLNGRIYEAAVRYLHAKGWLLHVPMKRTIVAIDLNFAQSLVTMSSVLSNTKSGQKVPCIGTETRIWNNITEIIPDAKSFHKEKLEILSHVLMFMGVMELRYLREKKSDPMFCYSTIKSIGELPVDLTDFIKSTNKDTILVEREYSFLYSSCKNVLSIIVSRSIRFARPVVIGPDWCVFQNGAAQTTLYIRGEQCLRLETRCYMPAQKRGCIDNETQFHMQEYAFNVFCLFTDVIDFVIGRLKLLAIFTEKVPPNMGNII